MLRSAPRSSDLLTWRSCDCIICYTRSHRHSVPVGCGRVISWGGEARTMSSVLDCSVVECIAVPWRPESISLSSSYLSPENTNKMHQKQQGKLKICTNIGMGLPPKWACFRSLAWLLILIRRLKAPPKEQKFLLE